MIKWIRVQNHSYELYVPGQGDCGHVELNAFSREWHYYNTTSTVSHTLLSQLYRVIRRTKKPTRYKTDVGIWHVNCTT